MPKIKKTVTKEANELAEALDLAPADAVEWITRHRLTASGINSRVMKHFILILCLFLSLGLSVSS
jgi:hypothetical protein